MRKRILTTFVFFVLLLTSATADAKRATFSFVEPYVDAFSRAAVPKAAPPEASLGSRSLADDYDYAVQSSLQTRADDLRDLLDAVSAETRRTFDVAVDSALSVDEISYLKKALVLGAPQLETFYRNGSVRSFASDVDDLRKFYEKESPASINGDLTGVKNAREKAVARRFVTATVSLMELPTEQKLKVYDRLRLAKSIDDQIQAYEELFCLNGFNDDVIRRLLIYPDVSNEEDDRNDLRDYFSIKEIAFSKLFQPEVLSNKELLQNERILRTYCENNLRRSQRDANALAANWLFRYANLLANREDGEYDLENYRQSVQLADQIVAKKFGARALPYAEWLDRTAIITCASNERFLHAQAQEIETRLKSSLDIRRELRLPDAPTRLAAFYLISARPQDAKNATTPYKEVVSKKPFENATWKNSWDRMVAMRAVADYGLALCLSGQVDEGSRLLDAAAKAFDEIAKDRFNARDLGNLYQWDWLEETRRALYRRRAQTRIQLSRYDEAERLLERCVEMKKRRFEAQTAYELQRVVGSLYGADVIRYKPTSRIPIFVETFEKLAQEVEKALDGDLELQAQDANTLKKIFGVEYVDLRLSVDATGSPNRATQEERRKKIRELRDALQSKLFRLKKLRSNSDEAALLEDYLRAVAALKKGDVEKAVETARKIDVVARELPRKERRRRRVDAALVCAEALRRRGKFDEAKQLLNEVAKEFDEQKDAQTVDFERLAVELGKTNAESVSGNQDATPTQRDEGIDANKQNDGDAE